MSRFKKLGAFVFFAALSLAVLWLLLPSHSRAPATFSDGFYSLPPGGYFAGQEFNFHDGRFECLAFSDTGNPPPLLGRYQLSGAEVRLSFDKPGEKPIVLHYRNVGGVAVLLYDAAASLYDKEHHLGTGGFDLYTLKQDRNTDHNFWWTGLFRHFPDFAKAFPQETRKQYDVSSIQYLRLWWRDYCSRNPAVYRYLPSRLTNL